MLIWNQPPRPAWCATLRAISPPSERATWLTIAWEPGDRWAPVQRWMIFQCFPETRQTASIFAQLRGPHPRSRGRYCERRGRWVDGPAPLITRTAWTIYQTEHGWARPLWVVQGPRGGHKYRLTTWEAQLSKAAGGPEDTPDPGALPYAEPDQQTWQGVQLYADPEIMRQYRGVIDFAERRPWDIDDDDRRAAVFAAEQVLKAFGLGIAAHADELASALRRTPEIPRATTAEIAADRTDIEAGMAEIVRELADEYML